MMEVVVIFIFVGLAVMAAFSGTSDADKPLARAEPMPKSTGAPVTLALTVMLLMLFAGLMGNAVEGSAYATVEAAGDADLLNGFIFACILGCVGGLMIVNGIARGLGVILLLVGILASVGITELVR